VTGEYVDATPAELRRVDLEALLWLINEHGPAFAGNDRDQRAGNPND
jgi:hypothetical protein